MPSRPDSALPGTAVLPGPQLRHAPADPFVVGLNLPWTQYGCDFGANAWQRDGGLTQPSRRRALDQALARVADSPVTCLRWFLLCDGRAGLVEDESRSLHLDRRILADLDVALAAVTRRGLRLMFVLFDFLWCARPRLVQGVELGGRSRHLFNHSRRAQLIDQVVAPLVSHCAGHDAVQSWDLMNEPDWLVTWQQPTPWRWVVSRWDVTRAFADLVEAVRSHAPQPISIGVANEGGLTLVRDLALDFYQVHWYDKFGLDPVLSRRVTSLGLDRPLVLGEFPTRHTAVAPATVLRSARALGYAGAFAWSLLAQDAASDGAAAVRAVRTHPAT